MCMGLRGWGLDCLTVDNSRCRWICGPKFDFKSLYRSFQFYKFFNQGYLNLVLNVHTFVYEHDLIVSRKSFLAECLIFYTELCFIYAYLLYDQTCDT